jgi:hypothetical protein
MSEVYQSKEVRKKRRRNNEGESTNRVRNQRLAHVDDVCGACGGICVLPVEVAVTKR